MTTNANTQGKNRYMPGIDGLRALSVLAVIAYHLDLHELPGGFLGVGVFFVLSGYLITDQLIARWQQERRLDLKTFWLRRARRLLPAMFLTTAAVSAWLAIVDPSRLGDLAGDIGSAAAYVNNWWLIYHQVSYFESFGPPSPFGHYWSLAVEEQFYLVWPIALLVLLRFVPRRGGAAAWMLAGAAASALLMALLYSPGADPSRVYYGSDTRVFGLLIGAALAVVWPSRKLAAALPQGRRVVLDAIGAGALAAILYMVVQVSEYDPFVYRGGLALLSVLTAIVVAVLAHPASRLARMLSAKSLRWIGARSYGLYLWHYPVIVLTNPVVNTGEFHLTRALLQVAASFVLAALSWKLVEEPILRGGKRRDSQAASRGADMSKERKRKPAVALLTTGLALAMCVSCGGAGLTDSASVVAAKQEPDVSKPKVPVAISIVLPALKPGPVPLDSQTVGWKPDDAIEGGNSAASHGNGTAEKNVNDAGQGPRSSDSNQEAQTETTGNGNGRANTIEKGEDKADAEGEAKVEPVSGKGVTIIGDSVLLAVESYLEKRLPGAVMDGKIGRQLSHADDTVEALDKAGKLGDIVIVELGTNGTFSDKSLTYLLELLGKDRSILMVTTRVPKKWQDSVNDKLKAAASAYDNVTLVDWYALSAGKDEYFGKDGVHPTRTGAEAYAAMLAESVEDARSNMQK